MSKLIYLWKFVWAKKMNSDNKLLKDLRILRYGFVG